MRGGKDPFFSPTPPDGIIAVKSIVVEYPDEQLPLECHKEAADADTHIQINPKRFQKSCHRTEPRYLTRAQ